MTVQSEPASRAQHQLERFKVRLDNMPLFRREGRVTQVVGTVVEADLPGVAVGALAEVGGVLAEVIGFREHQALLMPLGLIEGIAHGTTVKVLSQELTIPVGEGLLGRVVDPLGNPLDGRPLNQCAERRGLRSDAPSPMSRSLIRKSLPTGIRVIDGLLTLGEGQRVAVMAGSGVGKSTLMGMLARGSHADVNVVALVGERGREVREFIEHDLGAEGMAKTVMVVATSDSSPVVQVKCVEAAMSVAEYFRDQGKSVMLMADSLTRLAMAQRQIGLAAGEPPTTKGYTPSVFTMLPRLLERAGQGASGGSITAICTVLVEGEDMDDPVADMVRGIVDGHMVMSRKLASHGHYPPIDVLQSLSRTMSLTASPAQQKAAGRIRDFLATWRENEEIIRLGAYKKGTDANVDKAVEMHPAIEAFLRQGVEERESWDSVLCQLGVLGEQNLGEGAAKAAPRSGRPAKTPAENGSPSARTARKMADGSASVNANRARREKSNGNDAKTAKPAPKIKGVRRAPKKRR